MPLIKPRLMKAISSINAEPQKMSSQIQNILLLDVAGATGREISEIVSLSETRISIIRNTPWYKERRVARWSELEKSVIDKQSSNITQEQVKREAQTHALQLTKSLVNIGYDSENEFARIAAIREVYKRSGFDEHKRTGVTLEIGETWAKRWDGILTDDERSKSERKYKVRVTETLS